MAKTIAKGAAGVALTAGMVAAGAALSSKSTRKNIAKGTTRAISTISSTVKEGIEQAQKVSSVTTHTVRPSRRKKATKP